MCQIGDFGLSTGYDSKQVMKLHCGTPLFFAPELIKGEGYNRAVKLIIRYSLSSESRYQNHVKT